MAILAFQKPEKVIMLESTSTFGKFEFRPLEPGFGMTIGNALRRILLSSLEGYAITTVKVAGVDHEFAAIPGVMEGMIDVILKLKQVRFVRTVDNTDFEKVSINVAGVTELTAGYISNFLTSFKVLNPELVICHLAPGTKMQITITIGKGRGYVPAEENTPANAEFGLLPIDSIHTPIVNVKYSREDYRVEQRTDYEKLNLEITTDGSIKPKEALKEAAKILIQHFMLFSDDPLVHDKSSEFISAILYMFPAFSIMRGSGAFVQGIGNAKLSMLLALLDGVVLRIGLSYLFGIQFGWGFYGFVLGYGLAPYGFAIPSMIYFFSPVWQKQKTLADSI